MRPSRDDFNKNFAFEFEKVVAVAKPTNKS